MQTLMISGTFHTLTNFEMSQPDVDGFVHIVGDVLDEKGNTDTRIQVGCHRNLVVIETPVPEDRE